jgi:site-specific DNA-methyltransferase (adenine-specific)
MFSFAGDTVLDPFVGTGSTSVAAMNCGRNSIGNEIDTKYLRMAKHRLAAAMAQLKLVGPVNPRLSSLEDTSEFNEPEFAEISTT